ncbi:MAG: hypothetical protein JNL74_03865 [Fibrobacteres bacterium]|nr:hypothetical protein [Fibrobacterota bacterium]
MSKSTEAAINFLMKGEWDLCLAEISNQRSGEGDCWEYWWIEARILRLRDNNPVTAFEKIDYSLSVFGYNFYLLDSGLSYLNLSGKYAEVVVFWRKYREHWLCNQTNPTQIAVHLLHAYSLLKRPFDGLEEIKSMGLLVSVANDWSISATNDAYYFNVSCLYAQIGDVRQMLEYAQAALAIKDKMVQYLTDESFASMRTKTIFADFIEYNNNKFNTYLCLQKNNHRVEVFTRANSFYSLMVVECTDGVYQLKKWERTESAVTEDNQFSSHADLLMYRNAFVENLLSQGYASADYPYAAEWITTLRDVFIGCASSRGISENMKPVFTLEWDYVYEDLKPEVHPLTRSYYFYGDFGEDDHIGFLPIIPTLDWFKEIILKSIEGVTLILENARLECAHSEHDSGDEFSFLYPNDDQKEIVA